MNKTLLTAVSAIAIMGMAPAYADVEVKAGVSAENLVKPVSVEAAEQSTGSFSKDVESAWGDIKHDTSEAYENIKATVVGEANTDEGFKTVTIDERMTATGMIGRSVHNAKGEGIATVKDIILDRDGKASMIVVADGEFIGMGKQAAFDYNAITRMNADGDFIMPITEAMIANAAEFSYDREDYSDNVRVVPSNGYSVAELLDGQLVDEKKETVAEIDNISLQNGTATQLIVGFDKILGLGGEKATIGFDAAEVVQDGDGYDFQLSANQTAQFEAYKKSTTN